MIQRGSDSRQLRFVTAAGCTPGGEDGSAMKPVKPTMPSSARCWTPLLGLLLLAVASASAAVAGDVPPNVVLILIDDLGWTDLGVYGSRFHETPNIDRLAAEGLRFSNAYAAAPVCSPTRASLLTGKSPARLHLTNFIPGSGAPGGSPVVPPDGWLKALPAAEETLAERLKRAGYATGMIGKWHLGDPPPKEQGFDEDRSDGFWSFVRYWIPPILFDTYLGEYYPDLLSRRAVDFIERHAQEARPFFLLLSHDTVHVPLQAKAEKIARYEAKRERLHPGPGEQQNAVCAAMVESMDESVGRVMDALERLEIDDRTILLFGSDNGGLTVAEPLFSGHFRHTPATTVAPLRAGKGYLYEGGLRVPWIVRLPGVTPRGASSDEPIITHDFFPTLAELAGVPAEDPSIDGQSLLPLLRDPRRSLGRDALFFHYPHYSNQGGRPGGAIRAGRWKLIERYEDGSLELYDLESDIGEQRNLAAERPERAAELARRLAEWRERVGAQMPEPNPEGVSR
jgi:arylsulfatase A